MEHAIEHVSFLKESIIYVILNLRQPGALIPALDLCQPQPAVVDILMEQFVLSSFSCNIETQTWNGSVCMESRSILEKYALICTDFRYHS